MPAEDEVLAQLVEPITVDHVAWATATDAAPSDILREEAAERRSDGEADGRDAGPDPDRAPTANAEASQPPA
jgi:hypothetical protein